MKEFDFEFCFKGERNYVHGTDIYNVVTSELADHIGGELRRVDLMINKMSTSNLIGRLWGVPPTPPVEAATAKMSFEVGRRKYFLSLKEAEIPVTCRYKYDEDSIVAPAEVDAGAQTIRLRNRTEFSPIEVVVALNKRLVTTVFPNCRGKWLFTRVTLPLALLNDRHASYELSVDQSLGARLVRSQVFIDGARVGQLYFSLLGYR